MSALNQNIYKSKQLTFSYWSNFDITDLQSDKPVVVALPPGPHLGDYLNRISFPKGSQVIGIDYPARGHSLPIKDNSIDGITTEVIKYLNALGLKNIELLGISYGSAVATKIIQRGVLNVQRVKLLAPGEYIKSSQVPFIKALFLPAFLSERVRNIYRWGILKLKVNDSFPKKNLKYFLKQFYGNMDYKVDTSIVSQMPCEMIVYTSDNLVRKGSLEKVKRVFPNHKVEYVDNAQHLENLNNSKSKTSV